MTSVIKPASRDNYLTNSNGILHDYSTTEARGQSSILAEQAQRNSAFGDWRDDFFRNGYAVIKEAIPRERADAYRKKALDWFAKFPFGFDINDCSTWTDEKLPVMMKGGMVLNYCAAHENWVWEARW
jgi:hypothetical protein